MKFPSYIELIKYYNLGLISGPGLIAISAAFLWRRYFKRNYSQRDTGGDRGTDRPEVGFIIVPFIIGLVHLIGVYSSVLNAWQFRRVDPGKINAIIVEKMIQDGKPSSAPPITLTDTSLIRQGIDKLQGATSRLPNHEHFTHGYRIQLIVEGRNSNRPLYISVYRNSSNRGPIAATIPHVGPGFTGSVANGGQYSCPEFVEWVSEHIDPLFGPN
jgi:hypothetical protein